MSGGTDSWLSTSTSSPALNVDASPRLQLSSPPSAAAAAAAAGGDGVGDDDDDDGDDGDDDDVGSLSYRRRKRDDNTLYIILGVVVGAILVGILVALFVCARHQHKQQLLLGTDGHIGIDMITVITVTMMMKPLFCSC